MWQVCKEANDPFSNHPGDRKIAWIVFWLWLKLDLLHSHCIDFLISIVDKDYAQLGFIVYKWGKFQYH